MSYYERLLTNESIFHPNPNGGPNLQDGQLIQADTTMPVVHVHANDEKDGRQRGAALLAGELGVPIDPNQLASQDLGNYKGNNGFLFGIYIDRRRSSLDDLSRALGIDPNSY